MAEQRFITFYDIHKQLAYHRLIAAADCSSPPHCLPRFLFLLSNSLIELGPRPLLTVTYLRNMIYDFYFIFF